MREPVAQTVEGRRSTKRGAATRKRWSPDFSSEFQAALYERERPACGKCGRTLYIEPGWSWCRHCRLGHARPVGCVGGGAKPALAVYRKSDVMKELWQTLSATDAGAAYAKTWLADERLVVVNDVDDPGPDAGDWRRRFASAPILAKAPT